MIAMKAEAGHGQLREHIVHVEDDTGATQPRNDGHKREEVWKIVDLYRVVAATEAQRGNDRKGEQEKAGELDDVIQPVGTPVAEGERDDPHARPPCIIRLRFGRSHADKVQSDALSNQMLDIAPKQRRIGISMLA